LRSASDDTTARETLRVDIIRKARGDEAFRRLALDHPEEACGHFGARIPADTLRNRSLFYRWYYQAVVSELRDEAPAEAAAGPAHYDDMDWDFEVTKYPPCPSSRR